jgi:hypothetical protein
MSDAAADRIAVTFSMTADDYARYFAIIGRQESRRASLIAYVVTLFAAIPVALALRSIAAHLSREPAAADLVGQLSLAAFLIGAFTMLAAGLSVRRIAVRQHIAGTPIRTNFGELTSLRGSHRNRCSHHAILGCRAALEENYSLSARIFRRDA